MRRLVLAWEESSGSPHAPDVLVKAADVRCETCRRYEQNPLDRGIGYCDHWDVSDLGFVIVAGAFLGCLAWEPRADPA